MAGANHGWRREMNRGQKMIYKNPETGDKLVAKKHSNGTWTVKVHQGGLMGFEKLLGEFNRRREARKKITSYARKNPVKGSGSGSKSGDRGGGRDVGVGMFGQPGFDAGPIRPF